MRGPTRLLCDADVGKPCERKVVLEVRRQLGQPELAYSLHYCDRHQKRALERPRCVVSEDRRKI